MADGPVLRSKPLGGADCPPQSETEKTETAMRNQQWLSNKRELTRVKRNSCSTAVGQIPCSTECVSSY